MTARVHFGGYRTDIWTPIEVGVSVVAPDTVGRKVWKEHFEARASQLPAGFEIRESQGRSVDFLTTINWADPAELTPMLETQVAEVFTKYVDVLRAVMTSMAAPLPDSPPPAA